MGGGSVREALLTALHTVGDSDTGSGGGRWCRWTWVVRGLVPGV